MVKQQEVVFLESGKRVEPQKKGSSFLKISEFTVVSITRSSFKLDLLRKEAGEKLAFLQESVSPFAMERIELGSWPRGAKTLERTKKDLLRYAIPKELRNHFSFMQCIESPLRRFAEIKCQKDNYLFGLHYIRLIEIGGKKRIPREIFDFIYKLSIETMRMDYLKKLERFKEYMTIEVREYREKQNLLQDIE